MADKLNLPAATIEAWEARYIREVATASGNYADEIKHIDELIARVEAGKVWTESGHDAFIGPMQWTDDAIASAAGNVPAAGGGGADEKKRVVLVLGGMLGALILTGIFFVGPLFAGGGSKRTPTPALDGPGVVATFAPPEAVDDANLKLPLDVPRSVEIAGVAYQVLAGKVSDTGAMVYPDIAGPQAVWFQSPVNWLLGVAEPVALSLKVGDKVLARTISGRVLAFAVYRVSDVEPQEIESLAQTRVGLTLFPLPSSGTPVRVVYAHYDSSGEQPEAPRAQAAIGTAVAIPGGQFVVTGAAASQDEGGLYAVTVRGQTVTALIAPALDVAGELYPALTSLPDSGEFIANFSVPDIGPAQFVAGETRVDVPLSRPILTAVILAVRSGAATLDVDVLLTVTGGAAYLRPGDAALLLPTTPNAQAGPGEIAPMSITPSNVRVEPGQVVNATLHFSWMAGFTQARLRLLDQLYQLFVY